jgi:hypothetical protein
LALEAGGGRTFTSNLQRGELGIWVFRLRTPLGEALPHLRNIVEPLKKESGIYQRTLGRPDRYWACITSRLRRGTSRDK